MAAEMLSDQMLREYEQTMRSQQSDARYPQLLLGLWTRKAGVVYHRERPNTGLISVAVHHKVLSAAQKTALGEFRLQQYVLCGMYNLPTVVKQDVKVDPAVEELGPDALHVLVGTRDGRLLAYFCMQPADDNADAPKKGITPFNFFRPALARHNRYLGEDNRPQFPCEQELFGPAVFSSLPGLQHVPICRMRELTRLVRNQAIQSPLGVVAVIEAIYAMAYVLTNPESAIEVALGCLDVEARRITVQLGMPVICAPFAPVIAEQISFNQHPYWTQESNSEGKFWPFVIATDDLLVNAEHFTRLNEMLMLPEHDLRRALVALRRQPVIISPQALLPSPGTTSVIWTADPLYMMEMSDEPRRHKRQMAVVNNGNWRTANGDV